MIYTILKKYVDVYEPVKIRGSGIKSTEIKNLAKLNFVTLEKIPNKTGTIPKSHNSFVLTDFGRKVIRLSSDQTISLVDLLNQSKNSIKGLQEEIFIIKNKIDQVDRAINLIVDKFNTLSTITGVSVNSESSRPSDDDVLKRLKALAKSAERKFRLGNLIAVELAYKILGDEYHLTESEIQKIILRLHQLGKLQLQMGPNPIEFARVIKTSSGSSFQWLGLT